MGFKQAEYNKEGKLVGGYAKLWSVKFSEKYADCRITVSKKNKQTNQYETEFSRYVRFIGHAFQSLCTRFPTLGFTQKTSADGSSIIYEAPTAPDGKQAPPSIRLLNVDVTNNYDKEKKIDYVNCLVFEVGFVENTPNNGGVPYANAPQSGIPFNGGVVPQNGVPFAGGYAPQGGVPQQNVAPQSGVPFAGNVAPTNEITSNEDIFNDDGVPF